MREKRRVKKRGRDSGERVEEKKKKKKIKLNVWLVWLNVKWKKKK